jgi:hypothetical protein
LGVEEIEWLKNEPKPKQNNRNFLFRLYPCFFNFCFSKVT